MMINNSILPLTTASNQSAGATAVTGLKGIDESLNVISSQIAQSLPEPEKQNLPSPEKLVEKINQSSKPSLENNLLDLNINKTQALSLLKVLEVENELIDTTLGNFVNTKA